jgi:HK97 family phage major capsid protein
MSSPILSRIQRIPVSRPSGEWPALDQYVAPTAGVGNTAFAGGVTTAVTAEGGTLTKPEPGFEMLEWRAHKIGGYTQASNELIADSPLAIEALLRGLFNVAVNAKKEYFVLRGNGVGQPLGILNSGAIVNVTPATNSLFSWVDVATMQSRFLPVGTASPVWLYHPSVWPDILTMEIGTAGASAWTANMQASAGNSINGYQLVSSQHLPQANNSGDVILADLFGYVMWERDAISIAFSEHVGFLTDQGTWRFTQRLDGKPWLKSYVTLADPTGSYTVSPFVVHND